MESSHKIGHTKSLRPGERNSVFEPTGFGEKQEALFCFGKAMPFLKLFGKKGKMTVPSFLKEAGVAYTQIASISFH